MFMAQRRRSRGGHGARGTGRILAAALLAAASCSAMAEQALPRTALRVCADPFNLPMSNREGEGYENKLAELFGQRLSLPSSGAVGFAADAPLPVRLHAEGA